MALQFPAPASSPYLAPNGITYTYNSTLGIWERSAGGGGGGVTSLAVTAPIKDTGTATVPNIGIDAATDVAPGAVELATAGEAAAGIDADRAMTPSVSVPKVLLDMTGAAILPGGDDTERSAITTPTKGMLRYNDTASPAVLEYYDGSGWVELTTGGLTAAAGWFGHSNTVTSSFSSY